MRRARRSQNRPAPACRSATTRPARSVVTRKPESVKKLEMPRKPPLAISYPWWKARIASSATARSPSNPATWGRSGRGPRLGGGSRPTGAGRGRRSGRRHRAGRVGLSRLGLVLVVGVAVVATRVREPGCGSRAPDPGGPSGAAGGAPCRPRSSTWAPGRRWPASVPVGDRGRRARSGSCPLARAPVVAAGRAVARPAGMGGRWSHGGRCLARGWAGRGPERAPAPGRWRQRPARWEPRSSSQRTSCGGRPPAPGEIGVTAVAGRRSARPSGMRPRVAAAAAAGPLDPGSRRGARRGMDGGDPGLSPLVHRARPRGGLVHRRRRAIRPALCVPASRAGRRPRARGGLGPAPSSSAGRTLRRSRSAWLGPSSRRGGGG